MKGSGQRLLRPQQTSLGEPWQPTTLEMGFGTASASFIAEAQLGRSAAGSRVK